MQNTRRSAATEAGSSDSVCAAQKKQPRGHQGSEVLRAPNHQGLLSDLLTDSSAPHKPLHPAPWSLPTKEDFYMPGFSAGQGRSALLPDTGPGEEG